MELRNFRRGRHLYSAGRPSRWALAHILVYYNLNVFLHLRHWRRIYSVSSRLRSLSASIRHEGGDHVHFRSNRGATIKFQHPPAAVQSEKADLEVCGVGSAGMWTVSWLFATENLRTPINFERETCATYFSKTQKLGIHCSVWFIPPPIFDFFNKISALSLEISTIFMHYFVRFEWDLAS